MYARISPIYRSIQDSGDNIKEKNMSPLWKKKMDLYIQFIPFRMRKKFTLPQPHRQMQLEIVLLSGVR